jgi:hypothetical protein
MDLRGVCAVAFPAKQPIFITANARKSWTYETALDDAASVILGRA